MISAGIKTNWYHIQALTTQISHLEQSHSLYIHVVPIMHVHLKIQDQQNSKTRVSLRNSVNHHTCMLQPLTTYAYGNLIQLRMPSVSGHRIWKLLKIECYVIIDEDWIFLQVKFAICIWETNLRADIHVCLSNFIEERKYDLNFLLYFFTKIKM